MSSVFDTFTSFPIVFVDLLCEKNKYLLNQKNHVIDIDTQKKKN